MGGRAGGRAVATMALVGYTATRLTVRLQELTAES
jgi:hypothetical protein